MASLTSAMRLELTVPSWITSYDAKNNSFTSFVVEVKDAKGSSIMLNKRYTAFEQLHTQLKGRTNQLPQLPKKKFMNKDPSFLEERRAGLEAYLKAVMALVQGQSIPFPEFADFLELSRLAEKIEKRPKRKVVPRPSSVVPLAAGGVRVSVVVFSTSPEPPAPQPVPPVTASPEVSSSTATTDTPSSAPSTTTTTTDATAAPTPEDDTSSSTSARPQPPKTIVFNLTEHEKVFLKELLLEVIIEEELKLFMAEPTIETIEEKTVLLRYARELLLDFPWFKNDRELVGLLDELLLMIPHTIEVGSRATRADWLEYLKGTLLSFFSLLLSTAEEDEFLRKLSLQRRDEVVSGVATGTTPTTSSGTDQPKKGAAVPKTFKENCSKCHSVQLNDLLRSVLYSIQEQSSTDSTEVKAGPQISAVLFDVFRNAPKLELAPPVYRSIFNCFRQMLASWMQETSDEMNVRKAKTLLKMVPVTTLQVVLKMGHPVKLLKKLLRIFFARPFGARSLVMRQIAVITDFKKTDKEQKDLKKQFDGWGARIEPIANKYHGQLKTDISLEMLQTIRGLEGHKVLYYNKAVLTLLKEELSKDQSLKTNKNTGMTVDRLLRMFWLEVRNRDKIELMDIVGDEKLYNITKRIIFAAEPALSFLGVVDLSDYVVRLYNIFKSLNIIAEKNVMEEKKKLQQQQPPASSSSSTSSSSSLAPNLDDDDEKDENETLSKKIDQNKLNTSGYDHILDEFATVLYEFVRDIVLADSKAKGQLELVFDWFLKKIVEIKKKKSIRIQEDILEPVMPILSDEQIVRLLTHLKQLGVTSHLFQHPAIEVEEMEIDHKEESLQEALRIVATQFLSYVSESLNDDD